MNLFSAIYDYIRNHTYARERARKYRTLPHGFLFYLTGLKMDGES
jgi:hypothetical protein